MNRSRTTAAARYSALAVLALICLLVAACATVPPPPPSSGPGSTVQTLQSEVSLSITAGEKKMGGRGYLLFKQPDRFHLAVLSPLGFTMMDIYLDNDQLTCLLPTRQTAYQGRISDLPDQNAFRAWSMMRWVVDTPPASPGESSRSRVNRDGKREQLLYDARGLLLAKTNQDGDRVNYQDYRDRNGVAFPSAIEMSNAAGDRVRIVFDEPELNQSLDDDVLTPSLTGMTVLPLTAFTGI